LLKREVKIHGPLGGADDPVDGAELPDSNEVFAGRYLAFPSRHHLPVLCLWVLYTWVLNAFYVTPRLVLDSPEPGSGKTRCWKSPRRSTTSPVRTTSAR
jgi:hypothetical protein